VCALQKVKRKKHGKISFSWVKSRVPEFNPLCFISDGASVIHDAFDNTINVVAKHIYCWWHQRQNVKNKKGGWI